MKECYNSHKRNIDKRTVFFMKTETYRIWESGEYYYEHAFGFVPKVTAYLHEEEAKRPCMIVVPGGGYCVVSPTEGELVALKFYEKGYQVFMLTYTTNFLQMAPLKDQPLKDLSRAVRFVRRRSEEFHITANQVAICGFSAGGHLCASLCVHYEDVKEQNIFYGGISNRPDAAVLSYPVITSGEYAHRGSFDALLGFQPSKEELEYWSLEKQVTASTPPCFLWATATDELVPVENSELFVKALKENAVIYAFHVFSHGKHGLSLADDDWADGIHQDPTTTEQIQEIMARLQEGILQPTQEAVVKLQQMGEEQERLQKEQEASGQRPRIGEPNPQVAVWPELADAFLQDIFQSNQ